MSAAEHAARESRAGANGVADGHHEPEPIDPADLRAATIVRRAVRGPVISTDDRRTIGGLEYWNDLFDYTLGAPSKQERAERVDHHLDGLGKRQDTAVRAVAMRRALDAAEQAGPESASDPDEGASDGWGPLRLRTPPRASAFPAHVFPECLRRYCKEAAVALLAPPDFVGSAMLAAAGAAIGQSVNVRLKRTWEEPPILYVIAVARPGLTKTPAIRAAVKPLTDIDREMRKEARDKREAWEEAKRAHAKNADAPPPGPAPPQGRAVVKDITRESLVLVLKDNPRGVLVDPDEATAWVASFNEYKSRGADRQFWLSNWSCVPVSVDRKGGGESHYVPFPFAAVVGGLTPAMLGSLADERGRDDGFMDRILFTFPGEDAFPAQRWTDANLSEDTEAAWTGAIVRLHRTSMVFDETMKMERPFFVLLTAEAEREWAAWYGAHSAEAEAPEFPDGQGGAWSKMRAHAARFALILSRLRWACDPTTENAKPGPVMPEDVRGAIELVDYFKAHLARVIHEGTGGAKNPDARSILRWIKHHGRASFQRSDLTRNFPRFRGAPDALDLALAWLVDRGAIRQQADPERPQGTRGRKPLPSYDVHPSLIAPENCGNCENADPDADSSNKNNSPAHPENGQRP